MPKFTRLVREITAGCMILTGYGLLISAPSSANGGLGIAGDPMNPIYAASEISIHPEPPVAGNDTVLCVELSNPTPNPQTLTVQFGVAPLGIGVPFGPVGETDAEIPADGRVTRCATWVPQGPGPWSVQVTLMLSGHTDIWVQRNLDMDQPLEPGVPHSREFLVGNPTENTAVITLGLIPHLPDWGLELSQDVLKDMAPGEVRCVLLTVTPPAALPPNGTPIVDVEGFISGVLIGGFRKIYTSDVEGCEGDFDGDGDVDGRDVTVLANHPAEIEVGLFAGNFGRTDCPKPSPLDATVIGRIVCPGPVPCAGNPPAEDIRVELRNEEISNSASLNPDYEFALRIPNGEYALIVHLDHPDFQVPAPAHVVVFPHGSRDVGDIELLLKDALITGRVVDDLGIGAPAIRVTAARLGGFGNGSALTDAKGEYAMPVTGGEWSVEPLPEPSRHLVFRHAPKTVRVLRRGTVTDVDFELSGASAVIEGAAVDAETLNPILGLPGEAKAEQLVLWPDGFEFFSGGLLVDGAFRLLAQDGWCYRIALDIPPDAPYMSGSDVITLLAGDLFKTVQIPLAQKNSVIEGTVRDLLTGSAPPVPAPAEVSAEDDQGRRTIALVREDGRYWMGVAANSDCSNVWELRVHVDPDSGYVPFGPIGGVVACPGTITTQDLEIKPIMTTISGRVTGPDGTTPVEGAVVVAGGSSPYGGDSQAETTVNASGDFELTVREGTYSLRASLPAQELEIRGWLNPTSIDGIAVSAAAPSSGWVLPFRALDAQIQGTVAFDPTITFDPGWSATHAAIVLGRSEVGDQVEVEALVVPGTKTFTYTLKVVSGMTWYVKSIYEDHANGAGYECPEETVLVTGQMVQNMLLQGPHPLPQPFIVSFDGTQMQTVVMPDGVQLIIPPSVLLTTGATGTTVTLFISPSEKMEPEPGQEMIAPGYEIRGLDSEGKMITQFNGHVEMTSAYPPDTTLEAQGIIEYRLLPMYYSTEAGQRILADRYTVDTADNQISQQLLHF